MPSAPHPLKAAFCINVTGVDPAFAFRASIVVPAPALPALFEKLQATIWPFFKAPSVKGAITMPCGVLSPFVGVDRRTDGYVLGEFLQNRRRIDGRIGRHRHQALVRAESRRRKRAISGAGRRCEECCSDDGISCAIGGEHVRTTFKRVLPVCRPVRIAFSDTLPSLCVAENAPALACNCRGRQALFLRKMELKACQNS